MEARFTSAVLKTAAYLLPALCSGSVSVATAAGYRTANFTVSAPTAELAKEIGDHAEACRRDLAVEWLGQELPPWNKPCPVHVRVAPKLGAGGATTFIFDRGEVFGWKMNIQGSRERILDSVVPHEVTHTIFASHFRRPLPRWADEGACTTVEHRSEIAKQERMLIEFLKTRRGIAFSDMFAMKDYPQDVMPLYAQGHSLAQWLIESRGRKVFIEFLGDGMRDENWPRAIQQHYGFDNLASLQNDWLDWVKNGRPQLTPATSPITQLVASAQTRRAAAPRSMGGPTIRGQSPDDITPIAVSAPAAPKQAAADSAIVVASASGSIYADFAARAGRSRQTAPRTASAPPIPAARSVYDASISAGTVRR